MTTLLAVAATLVALLVLPAGAHAAGSPDLALTADVPAQVLLGRQATVTLTVGNPAGQPYGYNLSFRDVLPAGVHYSAGSTSYDGATTDDPQVIVTGSGAAQTTTLIWRNVADLSPKSTGALTYRVSHDTALPSAQVRSVGDSYKEHPTEYISRDERTIPAFDVGGAYTSGATGTADAGEHTTTLSAIDIAITEDSPEGELLRGAHDGQTVFKLHITNNDVDTTDPLTVDAYLPAGLEFLGCGDADHTTAAPTNSGGDTKSEEWDGSGSLADGNITALGTGACPAPTRVVTDEFDPDGSGPLPPAIYTKVTWANLPGVSPGSPLDISYVAAVPIRENTTTWTTAGGPPSDTGVQAANLDNNSGTETSDEQLLSTYADVSGTYDGLAVSAGSRLDRTAEDIRVVKTADQHDIDDGRLTRWTMDIATGEYRYVDDIRVTDTVPDGLCPLDTTNHESDQTTDCDPGAAPSSPYTSVAENADGSWTLRWDKSTDSDLTRMQPSTHSAISYITRSRADYQEDFADDRPVLAHDTWANSVELLGADYARCIGVADCGTTPGVPGSGDPLASRVQHTEVDGIDDADASADTQQAQAPTLDKTIRTAGGLVPADCSGGTYDDGPAGDYGPGDRVCYRLRVNFPSQLDTGTPAVTDFLPDGVTYVGYSATGASTVNVQAVVGPDGQPVTAGASTITWQLGGGTGTATNGDVFEVTLVARVVDPASGQPDEVKGNLMKLSYENSSGQSFPLRDQADFDWSEPRLTLSEGVKAVNGNPAGGNGPNVDGVTVDPGDTVTVRVDVTNTGNHGAETPVVLDRLPDGVTCADVQLPADCHPATDAPGIGNDYVQWTPAAIAAGATTTLTFDYTVPTDIPPGTTYTHHAGVRSYASATNDAVNPSFAYYPASNIDPAHAADANTTAADDPTSVKTAAPTIDHTAISADINQGGNGPATATATIGEAIHYTTTVTIPQGTVMQDGSGPATLSIPLGTRQTLTLDPPALTLNGSSTLPVGFTVATTGNAVTVTFPANYVPAGDDTLRITYATTVDDESTNERDDAIPTTATLRYADAGGTAQAPSASTSQTIVEPLLDITKTDDTGGALVAPGESVLYTVSVRDVAEPSVSAANDVTVVDHVPAGMTPVDASGNPVPDGGTTAPGTATWNASARTITFTVPSLDPSQSVTRTYRLRVDDPQLGDTTKTNSVTATATSYPSGGPPAGTERNSTSALAEGISGYSASTSDDVTLVGLTVAKTVDKPKATIGEQRTFTLDVTIPGGVNAWDATVLDQLPDGLDYEPGSFTATCLSPCSPGVSVSELPHRDNGDGSTTLGFFLGDLVAAPSSQPRTVRITYVAHVDDRYEPEGTEVKAADGLDGPAQVYSDTTDRIAGTPSAVPAPGSFDRTAVPSSAPVSVAEPHVTIDKDVSGQSGDSDTRGAQPGDQLTYTLTVSNSGDADAHDVVVDDEPDSELIDVAPGALPTGVAITDPWNPADRDIRWAIDTIPAGGTVTLTYTARPADSPALHEADQAINTADVPTYYAVPKAERDANGFDYRAYGSGAYDVAPDTVTVNVDLPQPTVDLAVGPAPLPDEESRPAEVGQDLTWNVILDNTSDTATLYGVDVTVRLPRNWTYEPGSVTGYGDPVVAPDPVDGDLLTWTNLELGATPMVLPPHARRQLDFVAIPEYAAKTDAGVGAANPHIAHATVAGDDATGSPTSADGPYQAGPDPAQAILQAPELVVTKTPDNGTVTAGTTGTWNVHVRNAGDGTGRHVRITDTIPAGVTYTAGRASSSNGGFAEQSVTLNGDGTRAVVWSLADLAPGADADIAVPVDVAASDDAGTTYTNRAAAEADEQHTGETPQQSDSGSLAAQTIADMEISKTVSPGTQVAGRDVTFTLIATNHGDSDARNVTLKDTLPSGLTFASFGASGDESACNHAGDVVSCAFGTLAPGATRTVKVTAHLAPTARGQIDNTATVHTDTTDPIALNDTAFAPVHVKAEADVQVTKTASVPDPSDHGNALQGRDVDYTIMANNDGPSAASDVTMTDALPSGTSFRSLDAPGDWSCTTPAVGATGTVTCTIPSFAPQAHAAFHVVARADEAGTPVNGASVATSTTDTDPTNDSVTVPVTVDPAVDLGVDKTGPADVGAGQDATYTLTVTNHGPSDATGVRIVDTLPAGLTPQSGSAEQGTCSTDQTAGTVSCDIGAVAKDASVEVTVVARAKFAAAEQTVTNLATVQGDQQDPNPGNDHATAATTIGTAADVHVQKITLNPVPHQQRTFAYRVTTGNDGPSTARGVIMEDTLPDGVRYASVAAPPGTSCSFLGKVVTCHLGDVPKGAVRVVEITVTAVELNVWTNTAEAHSATTVDPDGSNNAASADVNVGPTANLTLTKTGPATVAADGDVTYTLTATNSGPSPATGAVLTDRVPKGMQVRAVHTDAGSCASAGGTVTCHVGGIDVGHPVTVTIAAHATFAVAGQSVLNSATVSAAEDDIDPVDNTATHRLTVGPAADVSLVKSAPARVPAENQLLYTLQVHNAGPQSATDVVVTDSVPAGAAPVGAQLAGGACAIAGQAVTCRLASLPAGATAQVALTAQVAAGTAGLQLHNVAGVKAAEPDLDPANNTDDALTVVDLPVRTAGNLSVTDEVVGDRTTELGRRVTFLITVRNSTDRPATGVTALGSLRSLADVVAVKPSRGRCSPKTLTCKLGMMAVGQSVTIRLVVMPKRVGPVPHSVTVTSREGDRDTSDNAAHARAKVVTAPTKFRLTKRVGRKVVTAGGKVTFSVRARNTGHHAAANVRVCDTPGKGMSFVRTRGAKLERGRACWTVPYWPAGSTHRFSVTLKAGRNVRHGVVRTTLAADNARPVTRAAQVGVRGVGVRGGGVTG